MTAVEEDSYALEAADNLRLVFVCIIQQTFLLPIESARRPFRIKQHYLDAWGAVCASIERLLQGLRLSVCVRRLGYSRLRKSVIRSVVPIAVCGSFANYAIVFRPPSFLLSYKNMDSGDRAASFLKQEVALVVVGLLIHVVRSPERRRMALEVFLSVTGAALSREQAQQLGSAAGLDAIVLWGIFRAFCERAFEVAWRLRVLLAILGAHLGGFSSACVFIAGCARAHTHRSDSTPNTHVSCSHFVSLVTACAVERSTSSFSRFPTPPLLMPPPAVRAGSVPGMCPSPPSPAGATSRYPSSSESSSPLSCTTLCSTKAQRTPMWTFSTCVSGRSQTTCTISAATTAASSAQSRAPSRSSASSTPLPVQGRAAAPPAATQLPLWPRRNASSPRQTPTRPRPPA